MNTYTETERRRLLAIIGIENELQALTCAQIYTAGKDADFWLYSDLEGFLCYIFHMEEKTRYLCLYDTETYELLFKFELYKDFEKYYYNITENFHCFEVNSGFIGLRFYDVSESNFFSVIVKKLNDDISQAILSINTIKNKVSSKKINELLQIFKKKLNDDIFCKQEMKEYKIEDSIQIVNPKHFELLNNIMFDREKQKFVIGHISEDLKKIFNRIGIRKSDFNDKELALKIVKNFIQSYDMCQRGKIMGTIVKKKERYGMTFKRIVEKSTVISKDYIEDKEKSNSSYLNTNTISSNNPGHSSIPVLPSNTTIPSVPSVPSVPIVPNVPSIPCLPVIPKVPAIATIPNITNINPDTQSVTTNSIEDELKNFKFKKIENNTLNCKDSNTKSGKDNPNNLSNSEKSNTNSNSNDAAHSNIFEEMKKVQLKKVLKEEAPVSRPKMNHNDRDFISNALSLAINIRRQKLTKNDNSETSSCEWSD